jgi:hypothetical protein
MTARMRTRCERDAHVGTRERHSFHMTALFSRPRRTPSLPRVVSISCSRTHVAIMQPQA